MKPLTGWKTTSTTKNKCTTVKKNTGEQAFQMYTNLESQHLCCNLHKQLLCPEQRTLTYARIFPRVSAHPGKLALGWNCDILFKRER